MDINDEKFKEYGRVLKGYDCTPIIKYAEENIEIPTEGNVYIASVKEFEEFEVVKKIRDEIYGEMPIECGTCAGQNLSLTGFEYHKSNELSIAVTDFILIIGKLQDIVDNKFDGTKAEVFFQPKGNVVELYSTTLHYAPCKVSEEGYITLVVLPEGTNAPLENTSNKNILLTKKNKFFMTHPSQKAKVESGNHPGLIGELIEIKLK